MIVLMIKLAKCGLLGLGALLGSPLLAETGTFSSEAKLDAIEKVTEAVARWQLANQPKPTRLHDYLPTDWTMGVMYTGYVAHAHTMGSEEWYDYLRDVAKKCQYKLGEREAFGDDHVVGQLYLSLYLRDEMPKYLQPSYEVLEHFVERPHDESLDWTSKVHLREWAWCDSLYMSPPTLAMMYAATGEKRFLDTMDELWWKTTDYLYNKDEKLYARDQRYLTRKEKNGELVFWARGNGWVFGGLCNLLKYMPADYPSRAKYEQLFQDMAGRLKEIQQEDGTWHAALLDPETYSAPESSGTGFYVYGMLWGINNGLLEREVYLPVAMKGWNRLVHNVHENGKLGFVQAIGKDPQQVSADETDVYGTASFLLAGHELHKMVTMEGAKKSELSVANPGKLNRLNEVIELDWNHVAKSLPGLTIENAAVRDGVTGMFLPTQAWDEDKDGKIDHLLVQVSLRPKEKRKLEVMALAEGKKVAQFPNRLQARFVPERKDDFAWENDRMAFRAYGPALAAENATGGLDVWTKKVRYPVVDKWYAKGPEFYHEDHGEGMDAYKVGQSLGLGGTGYLDKEGKLSFSPEYAKWEVMDLGPLRLRFKLSYRPIEVGAAQVAEERVISMDAGSYFFDVHSSFQTTGNAEGVRPVTGIHFHSKENNEHEPLFEYEQQVFQTSHAVGGWEVLGKPEDQSGHIGLALVFPEGGLFRREFDFKEDLEDFVAKGEPQRGTKEVFKRDGHTLFAVAEDLSKPVSWQAGAAWDQCDIPHYRDFQDEILRQAHETIFKPIKVLY